MDYSNPLRAPLSGAQQMYSAFPHSAAFVRPASPQQQQQQAAKQQMLNVKAFYNDEIRRLVLPEPSWERLKQRLAEVFHFTSTSSFLVKWKDEEDDYITLDSDEELTQALRFVDSQQLLRLFVFTRDQPTGVQQRGLLPLASQSHFTSFFTHSTPYASFASTAYPSRSATSNSGESKPAAASGASNGNSASEPMAVASAPTTPGHLASSPTLTASQIYASKWEFKEQWKQEKRALKEKKYLCSSKEEWKALKKEQKKTLKHKKDLVKTNHKLLKMERAFDPQDPKDHKKLYKLQQKQIKTTARALYARFVKHVSVPDGSEMGPDTPFTKTWRFRNEGTMPWPQEVTLMFISKINGDQMGAPEFVPVNKVVMPGEEVDVSVDMISPSRAGHYQAYFRLCYGPKKFGQRVWIKINVVTSEAEDDAATKEVASSFAEDDDGSLPPPSSSASASPVDETLLQKLTDLGFVDRTRNESLLTQHAGDIDAVVDSLLREHSTRIGV